MTDTQYTVHFQRGWRVGARQTRMVNVFAQGTLDAKVYARIAFPDAYEQGYRIVRIDHFDVNGHVVVDFDGGYAGGFRK